MDCAEPYVQERLAERITHSDGACQLRILPRIDRHPRGPLLQLNAAFDGNPTHGPAFFQLHLTSQQRLAELFVVATHLCEGHIPTLFVAAAPSTESKHWNG